MGHSSCIQAPTGTTRSLGDDSTQLQLHAPPQPPKPFIFCSSTSPHSLYSSTRALFPFPSFVMSAHFESRAGQTLFSPHHSPTGSELPPAALSSEEHYLWAAVVTMQWKITHLNTCLDNHSVTLLSSCSCDVSRVLPELSITKKLIKNSPSIWK